jgi:hypothetical protein
MPIHRLTLMLLTMLLALAPWVLDAYFSRISDWYPPFLIWMCAIMLVMIVYRDTDGEQG